MLDEMYRRDLKIFGRVKLNRVVYIFFSVAWPLDSLCWTFWYPNHGLGLGCGEG